LPRITRTHNARHALKVHNLSLLQELTARLLSFQAFQAESFAVLPQPDKWKEPSELALCDSIDALVQTEYKITGIPPTTILRCAILDMSKEKATNYTGPTTQELFDLVEERLREFTKKNTWQVRYWHHFAPRLLCGFRRFYGRHYRSILVLCQRRRRTLRQFILPTRHHLCAGSTWLMCLLSLLQFYNLWKDLRRAMLKQYQRDYHWGNILCSHVQRLQDISAPMFIHHFVLRSLRVAL
jgi:hypothetical protein